MIFFNNIIFANFYDVPVISTSIRNFIPSLQIHLVLKVVKSVPKSFTKSVQLSSVTHSCQTLCNPMDCSTPRLPLSFSISQSLLKLMSIASVLPSNHLILSSPSSPALKLSQHQEDKQRRTKEPLDESERGE